ncbi:hypothetical protein [Tranquillimonas alkanivorans]|uniref:Uncharacterized protein n=1 Tax=Tranquillimonas alkanivorans TaxID=441119 RepID=A0A1I5VBL0_9RHOB|nr:hypothetical protein [Tranquillimonas alkanivorans]SFQ04875.1 hypothetical protein SAMN04488047_1298 [Tranquillimonas alkanivorans]
MPYHLSRRSAFAELVTFLWSNEQSVQNAALLLGGSQALWRIQRLLRDLASSPRLTRRLARELHVYHELLALRLVGDPDRLETVLCDELDPDDPIVEDLCLLADQVGDHLARAEAEADVFLVAA